MDAYLPNLNRKQLIAIIQNNFCTANNQCPDFPSYAKATKGDLIKFIRRRRYAV